MERFFRPHVKICCIGSVEEAWVAIRSGASALGLVSAMPNGPGVIPDDLIRQIASRVPPPIATFLLTSATAGDEIANQVRRAGVSTVQIVDRVPLSIYDQLRSALPNVRLVQVVHVVGAEAIDEAAAVAPHVDALLLDSGNPSLSVKELGGTGRVHNWETSAVIREMVPVPVFLAGGLNFGNVAQAIECVGPFGVDVCSGVRTHGLLDANLTDAFLRAATGR